MRSWILSGLERGICPGLRGRGLLIALCCCCSLECLAQSASDRIWSVAPSSGTRSWGGELPVHGAPSPRSGYSPKGANAWRFAPRDETPLSSDGYGFRPNGSIGSSWRDGSVVVDSGLFDSVPAQGYRFRDDPSLNAVVRPDKDASQYRFRPLSDAEHRRAAEDQDSRWRPLDSGEEGRRPADLYDSMQPPRGDWYDQPDGWR